MENEIKVSVFCLAYNHEKYIRHTLDGFVIQKTNFKFEVLVHDDASTDSTATIIREYEEKYPDIIKPIYQTENQYSKKVKITLDILFPKAQGEYIAWCEGDDYWIDPLKLQKQYDVMEAHPECSICLHKVQFIKEDGAMTANMLPRNLNDCGVIQKGNKTKVFFGRRAQCFQTSCYFIRKGVFEYRISEMRQLEDFWTGDGTMLLCSLIEGDVFYINDIMSHYRMFSIGSWTSTVCKSTSLERQRDRLYRAILGDIYFDKISNGKYHKYIFGSIMHGIADLAHYDSNLAHLLIKKYKVCFINIIGKVSRKLILQYFAIRYVPNLYKKYVSSKTNGNQ